MAKKKERLSLDEMLEQALVKDEDKPYEVPENWVWTRLEYVAKWGSGGTPSRKVPEYYNGDIPWIKTGELNNGIIYDTEEKISEEAIRKSSAKIFPVNTVIIAMYGATIGKVAILGVEATTNQACACGMSHKCLNYKYLFYYLMSQKEEFIDKGKGGAQPNISQEIIKQHLIPLPPLSEQYRIVALVESLFEKLDHAKELVQNALDSFENRKSAILHKAFTGELTTKWREENGGGLVDWKEKKLGEVLEPMTTKKPDISQEYFYYIDIDAINNKTQTVKNPKIIPTIEAPSRASREVRENDVLFSLVRPYLKNIAFIDHNLSGCIASTGFYVCRCKNELLPKFLYYLLCSKKVLDYCTSFMKGDNSPSIRKEEFEGMVINLPLLQEQQEIVRILDTILEKEQRAKELYDLIDNIDQMKKSILARAFRGELGTNNPEEESAIELLKKVLQDKI